MSTNFSLSSNLKLNSRKFDGNRQQVGSNITSEVRHGWRASERVQKSGGGGDESSLPVGNLAGQGRGNTRIKRSHILSSRLPVRLVS